MVFSFLENVFFYSIFFFKISVINHEIIKKTNRLNVESYYVFSKKLKNKRHLKLLFIIIEILNKL